MASLPANFLSFFDHVQSLSLFSRPLHSTELYTSEERVSGLGGGVLLEGGLPGGVPGKDSMRGNLEQERNNSYCCNSRSHYKFTVIS